VAAFRNGGLDASVTSEPLISIMAKQGLTQRFATVGSFYPNQQAAVVCYGAQFATKRPDVGRRFMKAYLQGVRDYNDASPMAALPDRMPTRSSTALPGTR
jgi:NitT/TauT family transport system substrate-binding protein